MMVSRFACWLAICGGISATSFGWILSSLSRFALRFSMFSLTASMPSSALKIDRSVQQAGMSKQCFSQ